MKELLKKLVEAHGTTGFEDKVGKIMMEEFKKYADSVRRDKIGNVIAVKGTGSPKIMIAAHMDEIGFVVRHIDKKGFIRFILMGGFYEPTIYNSRVIIHGKKGPVCGVIGSRPPHIMEDEERKKPLKWKEMFIDIGAKNAKEVEKRGVEIGCPITFNQNMELIGKNKVTGKALDDRVGCLVLIEILKRLKEFKGTIYIVATVQEEIGLKGARVSAYGIRPDLCLVLDVEISGDHPGVKEEESNVVLGKGPVITYVESCGRGLVADPLVNKWLIDVAKEKKIPFQVEVTPGGMTDAAVIYTIGEGIPSTSIGIPTRYIHSPVEVIDLRDVENAVKLVVSAIESKIPPFVE